MTLPHPRILSLCEGGFSDWGLMHLDNVGLTQDWANRNCSRQGRWRNYYLNKNSLESLQTQISKEYALSSMWDGCFPSVWTETSSPEMLAEASGGTEHAYGAHEGTCSPYWVRARSGCLHLTLLLLFHWFS